MDAVTLSDLRKPRTFPAVSVLMPTHRRPPQNQQDQIRLRNLLAEVRRRLRQDPGVADAAADEVLRGLERAAGEVDLRHAEDGLVLFATGDGEHHAFTVAQPVDERVVVDTTFATRDLVAAYTRSTKYWLLSLSDQAVRLWDGQGEELAEHAADGFPIEPEPGDEPNGTRSSPRGAQHGDERHRKLMREAVSALEGVLAGDRRPVVVAGVTRHQAFFDEAAGPAVTVAGRVDGAYEGAPASTLAELARPALDAYEDLREVAVLTELEAARGLQRYVAGVRRVAELVGEGRGEHLVVERGYYAPAVRTGTGELIPVDGRLGALRGADVVDDVVDDIIETTLEYGGEVTFVSDGFLVDHDRIALVVRF
ncbi:hypothetical protein K1Y72_00235 [Actinomadura sp. PM05-2]|uniref:Chemotaxis protein n=2 Tax=Actinomadura parmotrematis TaxID=2864039 RepID=A0ABS7FMJ1_9ACTN|nr:hypothetical protein [Actinomadura parmotrematis]